MVNSGYFECELYVSFFLHFTQLDETSKLLAAHFLQEIRQ